MISKRTTVLGTQFALADQREVEQGIELAVQDLRTVLVSFRNPHYVLEAHRKPELTAILSEFDLVLADGWGIVLAAQILRLPRPNQLCAEDLLPLADALSRRHNRPVVFVGGPARAASRFKELWRNRFASNAVTIDGYSQNLFGAELGARLQQLCPVVVFASLGAPLQERWLLWARGQLDNFVGVTSGGMVEKLGSHGFDSALLRRMHLNWLYLSLLYPNRFSQRYMRDIPRFLLETAKERVRTILTM